MSSYELEEDNLQFGQIGSTLKLCHEGQQHAVELIRALKKTRRWQMDNGQLVLIAEDDLPLVSFVR